MYTNDEMSTILFDVIKNKLKIYLSLLIIFEIVISQYNAGE